MKIKEQIAALPDNELVLYCPKNESTERIGKGTNDLKALSDSHTELLRVARMLLGGNTISNIRGALGDAVIGAEKL